MVCKQAQLNAFEIKRQGLHVLKLALFNRNLIQKESKITEREYCGGSRFKITLLSHSTNCTNYSHVNKQEIFYGTLSSAEFYLGGLQGPTVQSTVVADALN